ncbi:putative lipoprotein [Hyphomonas neptunium ATCC 15444]|uniref:Putative lipoprotein n=2 Tax=Hyphomonas TaxID=85 RepID=Q0C3V7_HYPNA|nr:MULTISPECIES: hypothetical protein [Hyphomonas]ABI75821.1 putative lipoprotein [Hyphomonas neptunium ATCC 15444]KCZ96203.1 putative lipoprotein [Hyphomonas hirschiana VP5]
MKTLMFMTAMGLLAAVGGCASGTPSNAYANPVDECASIEDEGDRATCIQNVVADVALSTKRNGERRP